jgi:selenocysteine-specific elongation factor
LQGEVSPFFERLLLKRRVIIGTAGHIDHGKTTLVKALTGIDTDRLEEEKRRGISIDLGFAHLNLTPDLRAGFVDVPGHERFIRNMLAGATGIDLVLLVIAADESIKPQTREHFEICRLLGIRRGVIALTKADLASPELAQLEIEDFVRGSFLEDAPVVPVSAITGAGLSELRAALARVAQEGAERNAAHYARLPIDRSFSIRGHGAVVTGTLVSGSIALEDELELFPDGKRVRVRGLEVHGTRVERADAGERTAVNIGGIESSDLQRGMMLTTPGRFRVTQQIDTMFELLSSAHPLKHRAPVHFHAGTAEVEAEARLLHAAPDPMKPGTTSPVRFLLHDPLLLLPGDRFIVRMFSPVLTIGGGVVAATEAPSRLRRPALAARTVALAGASPEQRIRILVEESAHGLSVPDLVAKSGSTAEEIRSLSSIRNDWATSPAWTTKKVAEVQSTLAAFHQANPLQPGMTKEALRAAILQGAPAFLLDDLLTGVVVEGETVRLAAHRVALQRDEEAELARLEEVFARAGLAVPTLAEALAQSKLDPTRARTLLQILLKNRRLIRVNLELAIHSTAADYLRAMLAARKGARFSVGEFKEWTGVSRKYAIPLLEWLDRERLTRREGDTRVVI